MDMALYVIIGLAAILFVWGIVFIFRGSSSKDNAVVPISDLTEIRELKDVPLAEPSLEATPTESLTQHLVNQNLHKNTAEQSEDTPLQEKDKEVSLVEEILSLKEQLARQSQDTQLRINALQADNQRLTDALAREMSSKEGQPVLEQESHELQEQEARMKQLEQSLDNLTKENLNLKGIMENQVKTLEDEIKKGAELKGELEQAHQVSTAKISELEGTLENHQKQSEPVKIASEEFEKVKAEKDLILSEKEKQTEQMASMEKELNDLRAQLQHQQNEPQNGQQSEQTDALQQWQAQKAELEAAVTQRENDLKSAQAQWEQTLNENKKRLDEANQTIRFMSTQKEESQRDQSESTHNALEKHLEAIKQLTQERDELFRRKAELEMDMNKIKEFNAHLMEKEKLLQYEVTKSRAQAVGLEKICGDFQKQIEQMSRPKDAVQSS